jgi:oxygen-independent coproporphyrinogen-3 oxidase
MTNANRKKELSLYIHIPFCVKKCDYCDFLSAIGDRNTKNAYVNALIEEIKGYGDIGKEYIVKNIFFGGGTPSAIEGEQIYKIMETIKDIFTIASTDKSNLVPEISLEMNPGIISKEKLEWYKKAGINRLSIGLQSCDNKELKLLGRIHTYEEFLDNYKLARAIGFDNINIDLMSALPGQNLYGWMNNLELVTNLNPEHISCYSLIIEEGTPFYDRYHDMEEDDELDRLLYSRTREFLKEKGYLQYEISNYSKENHECKQNLTYWTLGDYLGMGLGSSSLINNVRFHNESDLEEYMECINKKKEIRREITPLTIKQKMEEFMFLGLRLTKGIGREEFFQVFQTALDDVYGDVINQSINEGLLVDKDNRIYLTTKGMDLSNIVMVRFLFDAVE